MSSPALVPAKFIDYIDSKKVITVNEAAKDLNLSSTSTKAYLSRLAKVGAVKNVGRGLYQVGKNKPTTTKPSASSIEIAKILTNTFPLAKFAIWSLQMLSEYSHYMISKDIIFIETSKMPSNSMRDTLISKGYRVVLQPENKDFQEFTYYPEKPIFILERAELYGLTEYENYLVPTPERIWADLYYFSTRKNLTFDSYELGLIFAAMIEQGSINFDRLLRYATRRGIFREIQIFLYELMKTNSKAGKLITEQIILGRRKTLSTIDMMVKGAKSNG
jgi:hypothetical protein